MSKPDLTRLPGLTCQDGEPVFEQPWQAQAFALVIALYEKGHFSWDEWADALSTQIKQNGGDRDYYALWLEALEMLVANKNLSSATSIDDRAVEWQRAAQVTPHGEPILLENAP